MFVISKEGRGGIFQVMLKFDSLHLLKLQARKHTSFSMVNNCQPQMPQKHPKGKMFPVKCCIPPGYYTLKAGKPGIFKTATGSMDTGACLKHEMAKCRNCEMTKWLKCLTNVCFSFSFGFNYFSFPKRKQLLNFMYIISPFRHFVISPFRVLNTPLLF